LPGHGTTWIAVYLQPYPPSSQIPEQAGAVAPLKKHQHNEASIHLHSFDPSTPPRFWQPIKFFRLKILAHQYNYSGIPIKVKIFTSPCHLLHDFFILPWYQKSAAGIARSFHHVERALSKRVQPADDYNNKTNFTKTPAWFFHCHSGSQ
jgi:hypothetical protein